MRQKLIFKAHIIRTYYNDLFIGMRWMTENRKEYIEGSCSTRVQWKTMLRHARSMKK
jgi:hypothetical protein